MLPDLPAIAFLVLLLLGGCGGDAAQSGSDGAAEEGRAPWPGGIQPDWDALMAPFEARILERGDAPAGLELPDAVAAESLRVSGPGGFVMPALLARPAGTPRSFALVTGRALHDVRQTMEQMAPLLEAGHAALVCGAWSDSLPAAVKEFAPGEREIWRRERAVRALQGAFELLGREPGCVPGRRWCLGFSRGSTLILPLAAREPANRMTVVVSPVIWLPPGRLVGKVPPERLAHVGPLAQPLIPVVCARKLAGGSAAAAFGTRDPSLPRGQEVLRSFGRGLASFPVEDAKHVFDFRLAWEAGLGAWVDARLAEAWPGPAGREPAEPGGGR